MARGTISLEVDAEAAKAFAAASEQDRRKLQLLLSLWLVELVENLARPFNDIEEDNSIS